MSQDQVSLFETTPLNNDRDFDYSYPPVIIADILSVSNKTIESWIKKGRLKPDVNGKIHLKQLSNVPIVQRMKQFKQERVKPLRDYNVVELFAGAGGLAIGFEKAGFKSIFLNEVDKNACKTLRHNRKEWNVGLTGHSFGEQGLTGAWRTNQQNTLGNLRSNGCEAVWILEEIDHLGELQLGAFDTGDISESDLG